MDDLRAARADLAHKEDVWRAARATLDHVRGAGSASAAIVEAAARRQAHGAQELLPSEAAALQDLQDATTAARLAMDAQEAASKDVAAATDRYKKLELTWASAALSGFHVRWQEVHRG